MTVIYFKLIFKLYINNIFVNLYFAEFFKQFFGGECKKADISQVLSVAQQINKLGQGK